MCFIDAILTMLKRSLRYQPENVIDTYEFRDEEKIFNNYANKYNEIR